MGHKETTLGGLFIIYLSGCAKQDLLRSQEGIRDALLRVAQVDMGGGRGVVTHSFTQSNDGGIVCHVVIEGLCVVISTWPNDGFVMIEVSTRDNSKWSLREAMECLPEVFLASESRVLEMECFGGSHMPAISRTWTDYYHPPG